MSDDCMFNYLINKVLLSIQLIQLPYTVEEKKKKKI